MGQFQRFQTRPTAVEAVRLAEDASNWAEVAQFLEIDLDETPRPPLTVVVPTHKGQAPLRRGDWVVRGDGKTATLTDADFRKLYTVYDGDNNISFEGGAATSLTVSGPVVIDKPKDDALFELA